MPASIAAPATVSGTAVSTARGQMAQANLSSTDLLAVGVQLKLESFASADGGTTWKFVNSTVWNSYGPAGFTGHDIIGNPVINPQPGLGISGGSQSGLLTKLVITPLTAMSSVPTGSIANL